VLSHESHPKHEHIGNMAEPRAHVKRFGGCYIRACICPLLYITGEPLEHFVGSVIKEFRELLRIAPSNKSIDALGGVIIFVTVIAVIFVGPLELLGGQIDGHDRVSSETIARACLMAFGIVAEFAWFFISIKLTE
jgi:hypothetical protein